METSGLDEFLAEQQFSGVVLVRRGSTTVYEAATGLATLEVYKEEGLLTRGAELAKYWEDALHSLKGLPHVIDIRNLGLIGAVELEPIAGSPTKRAFSAFVKGYEEGILIRTTGDIIAMSPPLIISKAQIDELIGKLGSILKTLE